MFVIRGDNGERKALRHDMLSGTKYTKNCEQILSFADEASANVC